jgi:hypothetical protein
MLDYVLAEDDIKFMKQLGASVVRLPLNYRHFESDREPFKYLEKGFARLDQVIEWCAKHQLYVVLDMHAVQGWQDPDWHSDHYGRLTLIWSQRQFQDRFVALWQEFARRYKDNPVIAGYNVMNEPVTGAPCGFFGYPYRPDWEPLNQLNRRVVTEIRRIDPEHIIFLEGDNFSTLFAGMDAPFADNLVYSSHNYIRPCFGPGAYPGDILATFWDRGRMAEDFNEQEGTRFCTQHNVPLWVGEFGSEFDGPAEELPFRLKALDDQIDILEARRAHWTIWTYKDIGMMGLLAVDPKSEYLKAIASLLAIKRELATDSWGASQPYTEVRAKIADLGDLILRHLPETGADPERFKFYLEQSTLANFIATFIQPLWAKCFANMDEAEIDRAMQSFAFDKCKVNEGLKEVLRRHLVRPA